MPLTDTLVSIGMPVRNGGARLTEVIASALAQDHGRIELVISDNASTDDTEEICRELARTDSRIAYHRQPENIGLTQNFDATIRLAQGTYFRWLGDTDWIAPTYVSRCLAEFAADERLILVTTQIDYLGEDGVTRTAPYHGTGLGSDNPVDRFEEMLSLLNQSYLMIDPIYGLMRREVIAAIPRRPSLREDQIFAAKIALAGPWAHVSETLARRGWEDTRRPQLARRLGVPVWQARVATVWQCRELLQCVRDADLDPAQRRRARAAVARFYVGRKRRVVTAAGRRRLAKLVARTADTQR